MSLNKRFSTMWYVRPAKFLNLKGGCTGLSESTLVKMPYCWKSHVMAQIKVKVSRSQLTSKCYTLLGACVTKTRLADCPFQCDSVVTFNKVS